ncbi:MAG: aquaporin [bacterium]
MFGKRQIATLVAEFLGTGVLTLLILSIQRSTIGVPFFVAAAAGLTLALLTFMFLNVSGGNFNPAITIGMWTARKMPSATAVLYVAMQLLGAWAAYGIYTYFVGNGLQPIGGDFKTKILVAEILGTSIFSFGVAAAVYQKFTLAATAAASGLALMIGIIAASSGSLGLLNPAVALGVRSWVLGTYVAGPIIGGIIGVNLYGLLFADSSAAAKTSAATVSAPAKTKKPAAKKTAKKKPAKKK